MPAENRSKGRFGGRDVQRHRRDAGRGHAATTGDGEREARERRHGSAATGCPGVDQAERNHGTEQGPVRGEPAAHVDDDMGWRGRRHTRRSARAQTDDSEVRDVGTGTEVDGRCRRAAATWHHGDVALGDRAGDRQIERRCHDTCRRDAGAASHGHLQCGGRRKTDAGVARVDEPRLLHGVEAGRRSFRRGGERCGREQVVHQDEGLGLTERAHGR